MLMILIIFVKKMKIKLMKKITCSLGVPKGSITKGSRTSKGARTFFHLETLRKHYQIGCLIQLENLEDGWSDDDVEIGVCG